MKKGFSLLLVLTAFFVSCKKEEHLSLRTNGIVKGSWKVKARDTVNTAKPGKTGYDTVSAAERITRYRFFPNGDMARISTFTLDTFRIADSAITGKWVLQYADTRLLITDLKLAGDYKFTGYDDSTMVLALVIPNGEKDSTTITTTFLRQ